MIQTGEAIQLANVLKGGEAVDLLLHTDQPVVALYDLGLHPLNPIRHREDATDDMSVEELWVKYRNYTAVGYMPEDSCFKLEDGKLLPTKETKAVSVGVGYHDDSSDLPIGMWSAGHINSKFDIAPEHIGVIAEDIIVYQGNTQLLGEEFVGEILGEKPLPPTFLAGEEAITTFLHGYAAGSDAGEPKYLPWTQCNYLLPRVDWDLKAFNLAAYASGISSESLVVPEEHRYRVLVNLADVLAWYYTQHRGTLDALKDRSKFEGDDRAYNAFRDLSHPLDLVMRIGRFDSDLHDLVQAYSLNIAELIETTKKMWHAHMWWFEKGASVQDLYAHFHRKPDVSWADKAIAETDPEDLELYNYIVELTVRAAVTPDFLKGDVAPQP